MPPSEEKPDPVRLRALELAMRDVLDGMEELSLAVAGAHLDFALTIVCEDGTTSEAPAHVPADVIPFPRRRAAAC